MLFEPTFRGRYMSVTRFARGKRKEKRNDLTNVYLLGPDQDQIARTDLCRTLYFPSNIVILKNAIIVANYTYNHDKVCYYFIEKGCKSLGILSLLPRKSF